MASNQNAPAPYPNKYTTAFALFEALWETGITACFVNLGSDHPSIIEAIIKGKRERRDAWPRMITCPSEITAISMADGYDRVTGRAQAMLVHVDVGTQALGQGIHNASAGRVPVFIFAGMCPFTESGELPGSRTEYMHWLQEAPDQKAIVRQFCRHVGEVRTDLNVKQTVSRAIQFANSAPKGPVYVTSAREVLAQEIVPYTVQQDQWQPIGPSALPGDAVERISAALVQAERPLIITGYSGRDRRTPSLLVALANLIPGIRIYDTGGSDMCVPCSHIVSESFRLSTHDYSKEADVILLLDCDVPWIPSHNSPAKTIEIYHIDIDPLNQQVPVSLFPAHGRWRAECFTALTQLVAHIKSDSGLCKRLEHPIYAARGVIRAKTHKARIAEIASQARTGDTDTLDAHNIGHLLKRHCHPRRHTAKSSGLVCQVVGDGSFMCAAPSTALWVAGKYEIPILTVVLNNGGWKAPRNSTEIVYPQGLNVSSSDEEANVSFLPTPNYAALAEAAAGSECG
ncbi:thiamine pyrophosphate enzyme [Xylariaceae sp. FL1272]|nr:thiamine pyrophosphate enzyme [Xylariaceae sp. FL1272]